MTILTSTSDLIRVVTGSAVSNIEVQASFVDLNGSTYTPGSQETEITTATTTTVVSSPGASTSRRIKGLWVTNNSTASSSVVTVQKYNGTIAADLMGVTLRAGEALQYSDRGGWQHLTAFGAEYAWSKPARGILGISGAKAETIPREICPETNNSTLVSGTLRLDAIWLVAGTVVSSISYFSATTAAGTPTNQFFALYSRRGSLLAQSANDTTTAWAANTIKTLNMTSAYTVPVSDFYYLGIMVTATTVPTLKGLSSTANNIGLFAPVNKGNSTSALTTALPDPCTIPTGGTSVITWACVS